MLRDLDRLKRRKRCGPIKLDRIVVALVVTKPGVGTRTGVSTIAVHTRVERCGMGARWHEACQDENPDPQGVLKPRER